MGTNFAVGSRQMTLIEAIKHLDSLPDDHSIYAQPIQRRWIRDSEAAIVKSLDNDAEINKVMKKGMLPLLPVFLAKDVIKDWENARQPATISDEEKVEVLIYYAERDAWPPLP
jgi:hypothetical protein